MIRCTSLSVINAIELSTTDDDNNFVLNLFLLIETGASSILVKFKNTIHNQNLDHVLAGN